MAKKKDDPPMTNMEAQLWGTLSRVHGKLRLQGSGFMDRYEALNKWCDEEQRKNAVTHESMVESNGADGA